MWRTHFCSVTRDGLARRHECQRGTQECVRHVGRPKIFALRKGIHAAAPQPKSRLRLPHARYRKFSTSIRSDPVRSNCVHSSDRPSRVTENAGAELLMFLSIDATCFVCRESNENIFTAFAANGFAARSNSTKKIPC